MLQHRVIYDLNLVTFIESYTHDVYNRTHPIASVTSSAVGGHHQDKEPQQPDSNYGIALPSSTNASIQQAVRPNSTLPVIQNAWSEGADETATVKIEDDCDTVFDCTEQLSTPQTNGCGGSLSNDLTANRQCSTSASISNLATSRHRRSFTSEEKLKYVMLSLEKNTTMTQVAKENGLSKTQLQKWRSEIAELATNCKAKNKKRRLKTKSGFPPMEKHLVQWLNQRHEIGQKTTYCGVREEALRYYQSSQDPAKPKSFSCSNGWVYNFYTRNSPRILARKLACPDEDRPEKKGANANLYAHAFFSICTRKLKGVDHSKVFSMLEVSMSLDLSASEHSNIYGMRWTEKSSLRYEIRIRVLLTASASGEFLKTMVIYNRPNHISVLKDGEMWPSDVVAAAISVESMTPELFGIYVRSVLQSPSSLNEPAKSVLICDHWSDYDKRTFNNLEVIFVPMGYSSVLQPLQVYVRESFEARLAELWNGRPEGMCSRVLHIELAQMVSKVMSTLDRKTVINSFRQCGIIRRDDGTMYELNPRLNTLLGLPEMDYVPNPDDSDSDNTTEITTYASTDMDEDI